MNFRTRKEGFLAETAAPEGVVAQSDSPSAQPDDDDSAPVVGCRAMAECATAMGFQTSHSSMQKWTSPAVNTGPKIESYWGALPVTTRGNIRIWIKSRLTRDRPRSKRWERKTPISPPVAEPALPATP
jgi:hypothetical protein